jgi:hypothetical protein
MTTSHKPVGIALSGAHLAALLADRALTARLNASGLPFAIAGLDRIDRAVPRSGAAAPRSSVDSFAAATLADWAPALGWLAVAAANPDDSYDVARRVAATDHQSGGRSGLVLGLRDRSAVARYDRRQVWVSGGLAGLPASPAATRDAAASIRAVWGAVPATPQGTPVLAWRVDSTGEAAAASRVADILIWPASRPENLAAVTAASSGARLFLEVPAGGQDLGERLAGHLADDRVSGVILRPEASETALREFIRTTAPELTAWRLLRTGWSGPLRERLYLPTPQPLPAAARIAAPASVPELVRAAG